MVVTKSLVVIGKLRPWTGFWHWCHSLSFTGCPARSRFRSPRVCNFVQLGSPRVCNFRLLLWSHGFLKISYDICGFAFLPHYCTKQPQWKYCLSKWSGWSTPIPGHRCRQGSREETKSSPAWNSGCTGEDDNSWSAKPNHLKMSLMRRGFQKFDSSCLICCQLWENQYFRSDMSDILTKRAAILEKYASLRSKHPALPEVLRDFQVYSMMTLLVVVQWKLPSAHFQFRLI